MTDQQNQDQPLADLADELPEIDPDTLEPIVVEEVEPVEQAEEPLTLIEDEDMDSKASKIKAIGQGALHAEESEYRRALNVTGVGATRCKIFHSKISPVPLEYVQKQINEWLDSANIEVKFVTEVVGVMEGKRAEPNIIMAVWY